MVIQCKNLISLYILPDQRRVNLLVIHNSHSRLRINKTDIDMEFLAFLKLYFMPVYPIFV